MCVLFLLLKATPFNLGSQRAGGGWGVGGGGGNEFPLFSTNGHALCGVVEAGEQTGLQQDNREVS